MPGPLGRVVEEVGVGLFGAYCRGNVVEAGLPDEAPAAGWLDSNDRNDEQHKSATTPIRFLDNRKIMSLLHQLQRCYRDNLRLVIALRLPPYANGRVGHWEAW